MSVQLIKELRERTGAGFLDCKKAIEASNGNIEKAIEWLQEKGTAKAVKKLGAIAAEGVVSITKKNNKAVVYEVNSQTDFVATNEKFLSLVDNIGNILIDSSFKNSKEANLIKTNEKTIADLCIQATSTIGEKIVLRRAKLITLSDSEVLGSYVHVNKRIAAIVVLEGGTEEIARNVAMHVASMNPMYLDETQVPKESLEQMKKEILESEVLKTKPEKIRENIAKGMLRKQLSEITLVDQEFVMEKIVVKKYLSNNKSIAKKMVRFEVGEGIEKNEVDFAAEVASQMNS